MPIDVANIGDGGNKDACQCDKDRERPVTEEEGCGLDSRFDIVFLILTCAVLDLAAIVEDEGTCLMCVNLQPITRTLE
jgi:hypothetical protein